MSLLFLLLRSWRALRTRTPREMATTCRMPRARCAMRPRQLFSAE
jgi:hypothetical protein